jgi:predicted lipid carrier protein YhbT
MMKIFAEPDDYWYYSWCASSQILSHSASQEGAGRALIWRIGAALNDTESMTSYTNSISEAQSMQHLARRPRLPKPLALPLKLLPRKLHGYALSKLLNQVFKREMNEGELDFLEGRTVRIDVSDAGLSYAVCMRQGLFVEAGQAQVDLAISGTLYDYLLLVTNREDPDTLFFQRHLTMDGDTGLGVHLKNMLAAIEMEQLPLPSRLRPAIERCLAFYERFA